MLRAGIDTGCTQPAVRSVLAVALSASRWPIPHYTKTTTDFHPPKRVSFHAAAACRE